MIDQHDDTSYWGTRDEMGRIPLGDLGDLVIIDDGCNDADITYRIERDDGSTSYLSEMFRDYRLEHGDQWVVEMLDRIGDPDEPPDERARFDAFRDRLEADDPEPMFVKGHAVVEYPRGRSTSVYRCDACETEHALPDDFEPGCNPDPDDDGETTSLTERADRIRRALDSTQAL